MTAAEAIAELRQTVANLKATYELSLRQGQLAADLAHDAADAAWGSEQFHNLVDASSLGIRAFEWIVEAGENLRKVFDAVAEFDAGWTKAAPAGGAA